MPEDGIISMPLWLDGGRGQAIQRALRPDLQKSKCAEV